MYFLTMFTSRINYMFERFLRRGQSTVHRKTIGRVNQKISRAFIATERKMNDAQDAVMGGKSKSVGPNLPGSRSTGMAQQGNATAPRTAAPRPAATGGQVQRTGNAGAIAVRQQDNAKMGKGNRNKNQALMQLNCTACGSGLDPSWDMCPFCGQPVGAQNVGMSPMPGPQGFDDMASEKTMAISLEQLGQVKNKMLVGWLVAQNGPHRGEDFRLFDGKNVIGTAADCDIVVTDPYLSAKHCTIRHEQGNFQLLDLDSMNGTFLNQKQEKSTVLIDNDTIRIGKTEFKFKSLF